MANRILVNFTAMARQFYRSPGSVFWTIAFPVMLILVFGAIFSGSGEASYTLHVQDLDNSMASQQFIEGLNSTGILNIVMVDGAIDPDAYIQEHSLNNFLTIPEGFEKAFAPEPFTQNASLTLRLDTTSASSQAVSTIVRSATSTMNLQIANGTEVVGIEQKSVVTADFSYIDFFLPGTIGLMVMTICIQFIVGIQTRYRNNGIFKKLSTTPMSQAEWLLSQTIWQFVMVFISVAAIMVTGMLAFGVKMSLDPLSIAIILTSALLFTSMGMLIARFVKDEEVAGTAAGAVTFPMMFLAGSFFPLESMPGYLQAIASVLPLTYVNNGLRDAMIYGNEVSAMNNLIIIGVMALIFTVVTALVSSWKQD